MPENIPETRAEAREVFAEVIYDDGHFLPLAARRVIYVLALAGNVVAPVLAVTNPEYAAAIVTAASTLSAAAAGTALANPSR